MQATRSDYYDVLHNMSYDQVIEQAQIETIDILNSYVWGFLPDETETYDIFLNAIVFIENYLTDVKNTGPTWANELARRKLTIVLWWHKTLVLQSKQIHSIYTVFEGCTDCPRTLERLLNLPRFTVADPLDYFELINEPCEYCGCTRYTVDYYACYDCVNSGDVNRYGNAHIRARKQNERNDRVRHDRKGVEKGSAQTKRDRIYAKWALRLSSEKQRRIAYQSLFKSFTPAI